MQELCIVQQIGGSANARTRTRRILSRLTSERVTACVGADIFGWRLFVLPWANPVKGTITKASDPGFESQTQGHLVDDRPHSPVIEVGKERATSIASPEAISKRREVHAVANNFRIASEIIAKIKSATDVSSAKPTINNQSEILSGDLEGDNSYGDNFGWMTGSIRDT